MIKQDCKQYLEIKRTATTHFVWQGVSRSVRSAPVEIFDAWIHTYVEEILNVDTATWDIFDRWQVINAVLSGGFLELVDEGNGTFSLQRKRKTERKASDVEEKSSESVLPELQGSAVGEAK